MEILEYFSEIEKIEYIKYFDKNIVKNYIENYLEKHLENNLLGIFITKEFEIYGERFEQTKPNYLKLMSKTDDQYIFESSTNGFDDYEKESKMYFNIFNMNDINYHKIFNMIRYIQCKEQIYNTLLEFLRFLLNYNDSDDNNESDKRKILNYLTNEYVFDVKHTNYDFVLKKKNIYKLFKIRCEYLIEKDFEKEFNKLYSLEYDNDFKIENKNDIEKVDNSFLDKYIKFVEGYDIFEIFFDFYRYSDFIKNFNKDKRYNYDNYFEIFKKIESLDFIINSIKNKEFEEKLIYFKAELLKDYQCLKHYEYLTDFNFDIYKFCKRTIIKDECYGINYSKIRYISKINYYGKDLNIEKIVNKNDSKINFCDINDINLDNLYEFNKSKNFNEEMIKYNDIFENYIKNNLKLENKKNKKLENDIELIQIDFNYDLDYESDINEMDENDTYLYDEIKCSIICKKSDKIKVSNIYFDDNDFNYFNNKLKIDFEKIDLNFTIEKFMENNKIEDSFINQADKCVYTYRINKYIEITLFIKYLFFNKEDYIQIWNAEHFVKSKKTGYISDRPLLLGNYYIEVIEIKINKKYFI